MQMVIDLIDANIKIKNDTGNKTQRKLTIILNPNR